jgi:hypothetical protein
MGSYLPWGVDSKYAMGDRMRALNEASWSFRLQRCWIRSREGSASEQARMPDEQRRGRTMAMKVQSTSEAIILSREDTSPVIP